MKWSFILLLPALASVFWAVATLAFKRQPTKAQVVLSLSLLLLSFAIAALMVFFRGRAGRLFIYDYLFETVAIHSGPLFYLGVCSLTEPRGATLRQRRSFVLPLLFVVGLTVGAFWLGPRRYDLMCNNIREGEVLWVAGDSPWNFMLFWDHWLFPLLILLMDTLLMFMATSKMRVYQRRFNSYYARDINARHIDSRHLVLLSWLFLPLGVVVLLMVNLRPSYYKYWLIACSLLLTVLQWFVGRFVYRLDYDARFLAAHVRSKQARNPTDNLANTHQ